MAALSKVFRGKFLDALASGRSRGALSQDEALTQSFWRDLIAQLYRHEWVVYAKEPLGGPAQVLDYLARYTHRVAISNERLLGMKEGRVRLRVRDATRPKGRRVIELEAQTFIARFLLHVLPRGFKRIRHYGLLGPAKKKARLASVRHALDIPAPKPAVIESVEAFLHRVARIEWRHCGHCNAGRFVFLEVIVPSPPRLPTPRGPP